MVFAFSAWLCWSSDLIKEVHRRKKPAPPKKRHILHFFSFLQIKVVKKIVTGRTWSTRVGVPVWGFASSPRWLRVLAAGACPMQSRPVACASSNRDLNSCS